jgi:hypothetical protein
MGNLLEDLHFLDAHLESKLCEKGKVVTVLN